MKIIALSGKGGVGKTSLSALILDELARRRYNGRVLAVDADPAMTLYLALGLPEPAATVASVRDETKLDAQAVRNLPAGISPAANMLQELARAGVLAKHRLRRMPLDLLAMGQGEGPGCYCRVNSALKKVLSWITEKYDLVLVDNEAGLEHLSRYRLGRVDLFLIVATPNPAAMRVECFFFGPRTFRERVFRSRPRRAIPARSYCRSSPRLDIVPASALPLDSASCVALAAGLDRGLRRCVRVPTSPLQRRGRLVLQRRGYVPRCGARRRYACSLLHT